MQHPIKPTPHVLNLRRYEYHQHVMYHQHVPPTCNTDVPIPIHGRCRFVNLRLSETVRQTTSRPVSSTWLHWLPRRGKKWIACLDLAIVECFSNKWGEVQKSWKKMNEKSSKKVRKKLGNKVEHKSKISLSQYEMSYEMSNVHVKQRILP